jgi:hypothetical protein
MGGQATGAGNRLYHAMSSPLQASSESIVAPIDQPTMRLIEF